MPNSITPEQVGAAILVVGIIIASCDTAREIAVMIGTVVIMTGMYGFLKIGSGAHNHLRVTFRQRPVGFGMDWEHNPGSGGWTVVVTKLTDGAAEGLGVCVGDTLVAFGDLTVATILEQLAPTGDVSPELQRDKAMHAAITGMVFPITLTFARETGVARDAAGVNDPGPIARDDVGDYNFEGDNQNLDDRELDDQELDGRDLDDRELGGQEDADELYNLPVSSSSGSRAERAVCREANRLCVMCG